MTSMIDKLAKRASATLTTAAREIFVPLERIRFDPTQPRKAYHTLDGRVAEKDQQYIEELATSIKEQGLIQAIVVEELPDGTYLVRVGECRTRAHLLLGEKLVRAVVNNNLQTRTARLFYQLAENVNRNALSDFEIAGVVKELMEGNDEEPALNQKQVADKLGKSEGWVTRFVAFGDDELQRRWVQTGIADTAEKLYRLKLLSPHMQLDILRRVDLPAADPECLEKPLKRAVIDDYGVRAKMEKQRQREAKTAGGLGNDGMGGTGMTGVGVGVEPFATAPASRATGIPAAHDAIGQAFAEAATQGNMGRAVPPPLPPVQVLGGTGYALTEEMRQELLQGAAVSVADGEKRASTEVPPVNCRILVSNLEALLPLLRTTPELLKGMRSVRCEVSIPGELARLVASALAGVVVDDQSLSAAMQAELSKLG